MDILYRCLEYPKYVPPGIFGIEWVKHLFLIRAGGRGLPNFISAGSQLRVGSGVIDSSRGAPPCPMLYLLNVSSKYVLEWPEHYLYSCPEVD